MGHISKLTLCLGDIVLQFEGHFYFFSKFVKKYINQEKVIVKVFEKLPFTADCLFVSCMISDSISKSTLYISIFFHQTCKKILDPGKTWIGINVNGVTYQQTP